MTNKIHQIRDLKEKHTAVVNKFYSLKTKKAKDKKRDEIIDLEFKISELIDEVCPKRLKLTRELLCSPINGGGAGIPRDFEIELQGAYSGVFYCDGQVFKVDFFSGGWTKNSLNTLLESIEAAV